MEFKAKKIFIDPADPFLNDKFERKDEVENISNLISNLSSPIVFSINAPWGAGKTTFLEMLSTNLRNKSKKTIFFSAWETDFATDPLVAFLGEINTNINTIFSKNNKKKAAWNKAKKAGAHIVKRGVPALVKIATAGVIDTKDFVGNEAQSLLVDMSKDLIDEYSSQKDAIRDFKTNIATTIANDDSDDSKLYIFIDELDRCRPTYAIELLERIKHLLDIEGLVFILAMDKQQLSHSVNAIYGEQFDSSGYLKRFFDLEYSLQRNDPQAFINSLFETFEFDEFFKNRREKYRDFEYDETHLKEVVTMLTQSKLLCVRDIEQFIAKINIVIKATPENVFLFPILMTFLVFVKEYNPKVYFNYIKENTTPEEIITYLYEIIPISESSMSDRLFHIEGLLIAAKNGYYDKRLGSSLSKHQNNVKNESCDELQKEYSSQVIRVVQSPTTASGGVNLNHIVNRIEMLENFNFDKGND